MAKRPLRPRFSSIVPKYSPVSGDVVLELIAAEPPCERMFRPHDLTTDGEAGCLNRILEFALARGTVTYIKRCGRSYDPAVAPERGAEKPAELLGAHVIAMHP